jgi:Zn-dependent peptidase ImmA (M78 family)/DNA-binding XRE family transcriptional regulator
MRRTDLAYITPDLLTWAIDRSGIDRSELVQTIHVQANVLDSWEKGLAHPPFNKAREMAEVLRIQFGYLFLRERPTDIVPLPDLRRLPQAPPLSPSTNFLDALYQAMTQHDWYRAYLIEEESNPLIFVGKFKQTDPIASIAADIRATLGMDNALRRRASNLNNYLTKLSQQAEKAGVIVLRRAVVGSNNNRKLDRNEFQGFAISDPIAPLVFINVQDYPAAKIFTLLHELAHIWIGHSGISRIDETLRTPTLSIEELCNKVATEALVPQAEFESKWSGGRQYGQISELSQHFLVSALVIIRRARELNKIQDETFFELLAEAKKRFEEHVAVPATSQPKDQEGNFYTTLEARNSPTLVNALLADVRRDGTLFRDAARLLSMKVETVVKLVGGLNTA